MAENPPLDGMVRIWGWRCQRCGHEWSPRNHDKAPKVCPNVSCKSPYWTTPRRETPKVKPRVKPKRVAKK